MGFRPTHRARNDSRDRDSRCVAFGRRLRPIVGSWTRHFLKLPGRAGNGRRVGLRPPPLQPLEPLRRNVSGGNRRLGRLRSPGAWSRLKGFGVDLADASPGAGPFQEGT